MAKVIFLHLSVILFTGGGVCLSACWDTMPPPEQTHTPPEQTPHGNRHPPGADSPLRSRHPPRADTPQSSQPPGTKYTTPVPRIGSTSGRYASRITGMQSCLAIIISLHTRSVRCKSKLGLQNFWCKIPWVSPLNFFFEECGVQSIPPPLSLKENWVRTWCFGFELV